MGGVVSYPQTSSKKYSKLKVDPSRLTLLYQIESLSLSLCHAVILGDA